MTKPHRHAFALLAGLAAAWLAAPALAAPAQCPLTPGSTTSEVAHSSVFGGQRVDYRVSLARTLVRDAKGDATAAFVSTDYVASGPRAEAARPVIFLYNGGPNLSATLIQFGGLGPRRFVPGPGGAGRLLDNPDSPLELADMVFVDPVGTGFSHAVGPARDSDFWGVEQDVDSIADFITAWLADHHREAAPVFLLGESYGGIRSTKVAHRLITQAHPVDLRGEVIVSGAIDFVQGAPQPGHDEAWIMGFPSMAAVAWAQGKVAHGGRDFQAFLGEAERFAGGDYAAALFRGARLPATDRQRIAERMSAFIGIDAASLAAADLRPQAFSADLLKDEHKSLSFVDGREAFVTGRPDPFWNKMSVIGAAQTAFLSDDLGVTCADQYIPRARNTGWDWRFTYGSPEILDVYLSGTGTLSRDLQAAPRLHALLVGGYYDLNVPYFGTKYVVDLAVQDRASARVYEGGHAIYLDPDTRTAFGANLRAFIRRGLES